MLEYEIGEEGGGVLSELTVGGRFQRMALSFQTALLLNIFFLLHLHTIFVTELDQLVPRRRARKPPIFHHRSRFRVIEDLFLKQTTRTIDDSTTALLARRGIELHLFLGGERLALTGTFTCELETAEKSNEEESICW